VTAREQILTVLAELNDDEVAVVNRARRRENHQRAGEAPVVVASVQTLQRARLASWPPDAFRMLVVDEPTTPQPPATAGPSSTASPVRACSA